MYWATLLAPWKAGCNVVRMNMRSCGAGQEFSPTIYHAGRSEDVAVVMAEMARTHLIRSFALVGYSMGGNLVLKLAGELGTATPPWLKAVVGVSPLMDLVASSAAVHEPQNLLYATRFLADLVKHIRHQAELYPDLYTAEGLNKIRTLRQFDEQIVARYGGFAGAEDYYRSVASSNWVQDIDVPTLILHALDDPFIRMTPETRAKILANTRVRLVETRARRPLRLSVPRSRRRRLLGGENAARLSARDGRRLTAEEQRGRVARLRRSDYPHRYPSPSGLGYVWWAALRASMPLYYFLQCELNWTAFKHDCCSRGT